MTKKMFNALKSKYHIADFEVDTVFDFVWDCLETEADYVKETEPYATATINRLEAAAREVSEFGYDAGDFE